MNDITISWNRLMDDMMCTLEYIRKDTGRDMAKVRAALAGMEGPEAELGPLREALTELYGAPVKTRSDRQPRRRLRVENKDIAGYLPHMWDIVKCMQWLKEEAMDEKKEEPR